MPARSEPPRRKNSVFSVLPCFRSLDSHHISLPNTLIQHFQITFFIAFYVSLLHFLALLVKYFECSCPHYQVSDGSGLCVESFVIRSIKSIFYLMRVYSEFTLVPRCRESKTKVFHDHVVYVYNILCDLFCLKGSVVHVAFIMFMIDVSYRIKIHYDMQFSRLPTRYYFSDLINYTHSKYILSSNQAVISDRMNLISYTYNYFSLITNYIYIYVSLASRCGCLPLYSFFSYHSFSWWK